MSNINLQPQLKLFREKKASSLRATSECKAVSETKSSSKN